MDENGRFEKTLRQSRTTTDWIGSSIPLFGLEMRDDETEEISHVTHREEEIERRR